MGLKLLRKYSSSLIIFDSDKKKYLKLSPKAIQVLDLIALKRLTPEDHQWIEEVENFDLQSEINRMHNSGILAKNHFLGEICNKNLKTVEFSYPLKLFLDVTNHCNAACVHCFMNSGQAFNNELTTEQLYSLIDELRELGIMQLSIGGGEPFMRADILDIIEYARTKDIAVSLTTNGSCIRENVIPRLITADLKSITISVDGATEKTFRKIRKNLILSNIQEVVKMLVAYKEKLGATVEIAVRTSVNAYNDQEVTEIYRWAAATGVDTLKINNTNAMGRAVAKEDLLLTEKEFSEILFQLQEVNQSLKETCRIEMPIEKYLADKNDYQVLTGCTATEDFINVLANGDVAPCAFTFGKIIFGSLHHSTLEEVLKESLPFNKNNEICNLCKANSYKGKKVSSKANYLIK